jgi:hypothetical protein
MQTVARIIELFGGLSRLAAHPIRLEVAGFMPLCVEHVGTGPRGLPLVSVAYYDEQHGDLLRDLLLERHIKGDTQFQKIRGAREGPGERVS